MKTPSEEKAAELVEKIVTSATELLRLAKALQARVRKAKLNKLLINELAKEIQIKIDDLTLLGGEDGDNLANEIKAIFGEVEE